MITQLISEIKTTRKETRNFGITIGLILLVIGAILFWKTNTSYLIFIIIGLVLLVSGLTIPIILKPIYFIWMVFAAILGWIMTRVILSILYYAIMTPIRLISRLFGKQFIELRWDKSKRSYWNYRSSKTEIASYEKQF
jgi:cytochrome b subunit of formate dehydrogenase